MDGLAELHRIFDLTGKTAHVFGAGSGMGQAAAAGLGAFGASVTCFDISHEAADQTAEMIRDAGGSATAVPADIRNAATIQERVDESPPVDIMVVSPGVVIRKPLVGIDDADLQAQLELNLLAPLWLGKAYGASMAARGGGSIIGISSIRARVAAPGQAVYGAAKAGLVALFATLAVELGPSGVRVNTLAPGTVRSAMTQDLMTSSDWYATAERRAPLQRWADPRDLVGAVVLLASDAGRHITGVDLAIDGGWTAWDGTSLGMDAR